MQNISAQSNGYLLLGKWDLDHVVDTTNKTVDHTRRKFNFITDTTCNYMQNVTDIVSNIQAKYRYSFDNKISKDVIRIFDEETLFTQFIVERMTKDTLVLNEIDPEDKTKTTNRVHEFYVRKK